MFDIKNGQITLTDSQNTIIPHMNRQEFETIFQKNIILKADHNNSYVHDYCWGDIENNDYIYMEVTFFQNQLTEVRLFPQHHGAISAPLPSPSDCEADWIAVKAWYENVFGAWYHKVFGVWCHKEGKPLNRQFSWGEALFCKGSDLIYSPTQIVIKYKENQ